MALKASGITSFLIEVGGEFLANGVRPDNHPYWIEIDRTATGDDIVRCALVNEALATSGQLQQAQLTSSGYNSHIRGAEFGLCATVSVLSDTCCHADAWATALLAAGPDGIRIADANNIAAISGSPQSGVSLSRAAKRYLS